MTSRGEEGQRPGRESKKPGEVIIFPAVKRRVPVVEPDPGHGPAPQPEASSAPLVLVDRFGIGALLVGPMGARTVVFTEEGRNVAQITDDVVAMAFAETVMTLVEDHRLVAAMFMITAAKMARDGHLWAIDDPDAPPGGGA